MDSLSNVQTAAIETLLNESWNTSVTVGGIESLVEGKCFRVSISAPSESVPTSVIVKTARAEVDIPTDPDSTEGNPAQPILEEWTGLQFLNEVMPESGLIPKFYGGDRATCLIAFEDFGKQPSVVDALNGMNPDYARECLKVHAQAVATLHASTMAEEERYWKIRDALGPRGVPRDWKQYGNLLDTQGWGDLRGLRSELQKAFDRIGQVVPMAFWDEYEFLVKRTDSDSSFRAYIQNDSCPDNTLITPSGPHLIDFERGGYHLYLLDAAYCRLSMPCCFWVGRLPDDVTPSVESAYREILGQIQPGIQSDRLFGRAMTEACAYWIISNGMWMVHRDFDADFKWGSSTWRQRVFRRLEAFADTTEEFSHLRALGTAARETVGLLKTHWEYEEMPLFPAFR